MIHFTLAMEPPPTANRRLEADGGKLHRRKGVSRWHRDAGLLALSSLRAQGVPCALTGPLYALYVFRVPNGRRDWDASIKDVQDALTGVVWVDDRQIIAGTGVVVRDAVTAETLVYVFGVDEAGAYARMVELQAQVATRRAA